VEGARSALHDKTQLKSADFRANSKARGPKIVKTGVQLRKSG
jgi:hypothetical protein